MSSPEAARQRVANEIVRGLRDSMLDAVVQTQVLENAAEAVIDRLTRGEYLISGGRIRPILETDWREDDGETRSYMVYTEGEL